MMRTFISRYCTTESVLAMGTPDSVSCVIYNDYKM